MAAKGYDVASAVQLYTQLVQEGECTQEFVDVVRALLGLEDFNEYATRQQKANILWTEHDKTLDMLGRVEAVYRQTGRTTRVLVYAFCAILLGERVVLAAYTSAYAEELAKRLKSFASVFEVEHNISMHVPIRRWLDERVVVPVNFDHVVRMLGRLRCCSNVVLIQDHYDDRVYRPLREVVGSFTGVLTQDV